MVAGKLDGAKGWQQLVLVRLLGDLEARAAAPRLLSLLRTDDPVLAWTAARALARCGGPEEIEKGLAALRQQKGHLIAAAIAHLEKQLAK